MKINNKVKLLILIDIFNKINCFDYNDHLFCFDESNHEIIFKELLFKNKKE
ncbi:MAG: hypothetical protein ACOC1O_00980 [bacterium]